MKITFLGQGFESESNFSVGKQLIKFFSEKNFHTFICISAFASQSGVIGISKHLKKAKKHLKEISIITGIDQKGTSKEALEILLSMKINSFVFYQPSNTIFHPKIYLFEGEKKSELIIGSSNLTSYGLFSNVESSLLISIDNSVVADRKIIEQLKTYFKGLFDFSDPNLTKLSKKIINDLVKAKLVPTEAERKVAYDKIEETKTKESNHIISKIFPKRDIAKIPKEFKGQKKLISKVKIATPSIGRSRIAKKGIMIWESGKLTERDLNIPKGLNTNPTGSMLFKKGKTKEIDQRHYFRDTVFSSLKWKLDSKPETSHLERTKAIFNIVIDGEDSGTYKLTLTHNSRTDTRSYEQKNSMTSISWGAAKSVITNARLIGKSAFLFKTIKGAEFILEIK